MNIRDSKDKFVKETIKVLDAFQHPQKATDEAIYTKLQESKEVHHLIGVDNYSRKSKLIHDIIVVSEEDDDDKDSSGGESYIEYVLDEARAEMSQKFIASVILSHKDFLKLQTLSIYKNS